jgi:gamma-glutamylcyclotransferase (GGCT)/AIG2-like uncharacterized protein YtfP
MMPETPTPDVLPAGHKPAAVPNERYVFVYGTLRKGEANDINRLRPRPDFVGRGRVLGTLYHLGSYPGLVMNGNTLVEGEVYRILPELECVLDEIEEIHPQQSDEYAKQQVTVQVDGLGLMCLVYVINPLRLQGRPVIPGGDWVTGQ